MRSKSINLFRDDKVYKRKSANQDEFEKNLKAFLPDFSRILDKGFQMTLSERSRKPPHYRNRNFTATVMSGNIQGLLVDNFPENAKVCEDTRLRFRYGGYVVLFKKLDDNLRPLHVETNNTKRLMSQQCLPFEEPNPVVWCGYTTDKTNSVLTGKYVVCIDNDCLEWVLDLSDYDESQKIIDIKNPLPDDDNGTLVTVKSGLAKVSNN
jgi:hypothetical protein